ncbi:PREDICTED: uncharacterized protein LOC101301850 [Fragaria vesca subsp. vesca]
MAFSKTVLLVALVFAFLLISSEVSAHGESYPSFQITVFSTILSKILTTSTAATSMDMVAMEMEDMEAEEGMEDKEGMEDREGMEDAVAMEDVEGTEGTDQVLRKLRIR